jgi:hypothetical protein
MGQSPAMSAALWRDQGKVQQVNSVFYSSMTKGNDLLCYYPRAEIGPGLVSRVTTAAQETIYEVSTRLRWHAAYS